MGTLSKQEEIDELIKDSNVQLKKYRIHYLARIEAGVSNKTVENSKKIEKKKRFERRSSK